MGICSMVLIHMYSLRIPNFAGMAEARKSRRFPMRWRDMEIHSSILIIGTGTSTVVQTGESEITASFMNGNVLDLGTDTMKKANGTWYLLVARPGVLNRMNNN